MDPAESDDQDEESVQKADKEPSNSSEELTHWPDPDEELDITESKSSSIIIYHITVKMYIWYAPFAVFASLTLKCDLLRPDRIAVLGAPRCAAAVEPLQLAVAGRLPV